jgi:hypothetical protein
MELDTIIGNSMPAVESARPAPARIAFLAGSAGTGLAMSIKGVELRKL